MRLTGPDAGALLRAVAPDLVSWEARRVSTAADGTTVAYRSVLGGGRVAWLGASTCPAPAGTCVVDGVAVWRWPADPWLPALPTAVSASAVSALLGRPVPSLVLRAYRPGRRAVVQGPGAFLKVLRPERAADVAERHRVLASSGLPVPACSVVGPPGLLVLPALPGRQGREALRAGRRMPSGEELLGLLDRLPASLLDLPARPSWSDGAARYADAVAALLPADAARARAVAAAVAGLPSGPVQPVHGDLHEGQLLVSGGRVSGLLDVDRAGPGGRADDLACLLAHLEVLVATGRVAQRRGLRLLGEWWAAFRSVVPADELRLRTAGVLLSLATGPYRVQQREWEDATRRVLELAVERAR